MGSGQIQEEIQRHMIIQIRGTSGSGKTTVMREIMKRFSDWESEYVVGRRKPETYKHRNIYVCGHYESTCGGCDNIGSARAVYDLYMRLLDNWKGDKPPIIISEGLLLSEDTKWTSKLIDLDPRICFLTTSIDECVNRVKNRRKEAGNNKPFNESNTRNRLDVIERSRVKLVESGVLCRRASSRQAPRVILNWISQATR